MSKESDCDNPRDNSLRETIVNNLTKQLSEFELLQSMYPSRDELVLVNNKIIHQINKFIEGQSDFTPTHLDFTVNLQLGNLKLEVCINLPTFYPETEEPDVFIRCNQMNREQESTLNNKLSSFITEIHQDDVCIYTVLTWLQENVEISLTKSKTQNKETSNTSVVKDGKFCRYWIHSHHIYNKKKREEILSKANELKLTGFCLPGKPGIICIEGSESMCNEWWREIKSMNWKKIVIRRIESFPECDAEKEKKFNNFNELQFPNPSSKISKHANMKEFSKYIEEHNLSLILNEFLGLPCSDVG